MGWGGVDLIPVRDGETPQQAVDRVYEGGVTMSFGIDDDGDPWGEATENPGGGEDPEFVSTSERKWMLRAVGLLDEVEPGWTVCYQEKGEHRRWPYYLQAVRTEGTPEEIVVGIYSGYVTLNGYVRGPSSVGYWVAKIADHFAEAANCVIFHPDTSEIVDYPFNLAV